VDLKKFVEENYPEYRGKIEGDIYPPPPGAALFVTVMSYLWFGGIIIMVTGDSLFQALQIPIPEIVKTIQNNKLPFFIGLFLMNNIANGMVATGAFEVYLGDQLIFSKLQANRFPKSDDIVQALSMHLGLLPKYLR
jgi:selT/selW/selH-like putative selenoprotein